MLLYVPGPEIVDAVGAPHAAVFRISFHVEPKECLFLHHVHAYTCVSWRLLCSAGFIDHFMQWILLQIFCMAPISSFLRTAG